MDTSNLKYCGYCGDFIYPICGHHHSTNPSRSYCAVKAQGSDSTQLALFQKYTAWFNATPAQEG